MQRRMIADLSSARMNLVFEAKRQLKNGLSESEYALDVTADRILEQIPKTNHKTPIERSHMHPVCEDAPAEIVIGQSVKKSPKSAPLRLIRV